MVTVHDVLAGFLLPLALTSIALVLGWRWKRHSLGARDSRSAFGPLAIGLGYVAGWLALFGWSAFPPTDSTNWLFFLTIPLVVLGLLDAWWRVPVAVNVVATLFVVPLAIWLLARPLWNADPPGFGAIALALSSVLCISWVIAMDALTVRVSARRMSVILLLVVLPASAAVILIGHSKKLGQIGGLEGAALTGIAITGVVLGSSGVARGIMLLVGSLFGGVLLCSVLYAGLPVIDGCLLFFAPLMAWLPVPFERRLGSRWTALAQYLLVVIPIIPVGVASVRAAMEMLSQVGEY